MLSKRNIKKFFIITIVSIVVFVFFSLNFNFYLSSLLVSKLSYNTDYLSNNSILKEKVSMLEAKIKISESLIQENAELRKSQDYKIPENLRSISSELVIVSPFSFTSSGIINKGSKDGIRKGQLGISKNGLVGKISEVKKDTSEIIFAYNPNFTIMVFVGPKKIPGILQGNGVSSRIRYITTQEKISLGDDVFIATNTSKEYPGIKVGEISDIKGDQGFFDLGLKNLIDPRNIKFLMIVVND
jgi:rod shape-determining protein MreC